MRAQHGLVVAVVLVAGTLAAPPVAAAPPPELVGPPMPRAASWRAEVRDVMAGSLAHLRARVRQERDAGGDVGRLAVNLDIDNTALATYYHRRTAARATLRFARVADRLGVQVVFNTGRTSVLRRKTIRELRRAGFELNRLCLRRPAETVTESKPRCRARFRAQGFTIIANLGNNSTDFAAGPHGVDYERAYRLPNYGGRLS